VWVDPATDLDCMINRGPSGALCGYVGVPPTHPLHGVRYDDVHVDVHGGLTYSNSCQEDGEICHVPAEGREHDIWWFGFDCAHMFDVMPRIEAELSTARKMGVPLTSMNRDYGPLGRSTYKDRAYVTAEVEMLAIQLKEMANG
jgi:hypothetical protein